MEFPTAHSSAHDRKTWVNDKLQERKDSVLTLYFEEGLSEAEVAHRTNYSSSSVRLMVREEAKKNPTRASARVAARYDRRKMVNRSVLSGAHARLGLLISRFMANHQMKSMEFALLVDLTRVNVSEALSGYYDFRLTELEAVCRLLNIEPQDIFKGMHNGPIRATAVKHDHRSGDGLPDVLTLQPGQKRHVQNPDHGRGDEAADPQLPGNTKR